jgi:hypothetical protein
MNYIELKDTMHDALARVKAIVNVLCYSQITELKRMTVPTLMFMAGEQLTRIEECIKEWK